MKTWQCTVCKYIHKGDTPPEKCPVCGVPASKFIEIEPESSEEAIAPKKPDTAQKMGSGKTVPVKKKDTPYEMITNLMVKHHAHPISVHFPNGLLPVIFMVFVLAGLFNSQLLVKVGFVNLIFVVLSLPLVLFSGFIEWQKKYNQALTGIFKIKILAASVTAASCVISLIWYLVEPDVLTASHNWVFILINLIMIVAAGVAGHIGGKLVFKD